MDGSVMEGLAASRSDSDTLFPSAMLDRVSPAFTVVDPAHCTCTLAQHRRQHGNDPLRQTGVLCLEPSLKFKLAGQMRRTISASATTMLPAAGLACNFTITSGQLEGSDLSQNASRHVEEQQQGGQHGSFCFRHHLLDACGFTDTSR